MKQQVSGSVGRRYNLRKDYEILAAKFCNVVSSGLRKWPSRCSVNSTVTTLVIWSVSVTHEETKGGLS